MAAAAGLVPEGDFFKAIKKGKASVVTDGIEAFTENGIALRRADARSGRDHHRDGIRPAILGDVGFAIDGEPLAFHDTVTYRGVMFTGVPNLAYVFGYFRASWTLRADLIADLVCRLLNHMDERGSTMVVPAIRDEEAEHGSRSLGRSGQLQSGLPHALDPPDAEAGPA